MECGLVMLAVNVRLRRSGHDVRLSEDTVEREGPNDLKRALGCCESWRPGRGWTTSEKFRPRVGNNCEVATRDELPVLDGSEVPETWTCEKFTPNGFDDCQRRRRIVNFVQMRVKNKQCFKVRRTKFSDLHFFPSVTPSKRFKSCSEGQLLADLN